MMSKSLLDAAPDASPTWWLKEAVKARALCDKLYHDTGKVWGMFSCVHVAHVTELATCNRGRACAPFALGTVLI
jgi:hypothetical protein